MQVFRYINNSPGRSGLVNGPFRLNRFLLIFLSMWVALVLLQGLLWISPASAVATGLVLLGGLAGTLYSLRRAILRAYPLSASMLLGYSAYYFLIPPLATLIEWKPLAFNLENPVLVQLHATIGLAAFLMAHVIYRKTGPLQGVRWTITRKIYSPLGYFNTPTNVQLLVVGCVGLTAMATQIFVAGAVQGGTQEIGDKFVQAFYPLTYLPFCIFLRPLIGEQARVPRRWIIILAGYGVLLLLVSLGRNSRAALLIGVVSIMFGFGYGLFAGLIPRSVVKMRYVLSVAILSLLVLIPLADLATSMVIVRGTRADISARDLIEDTISTFANKNAIQNYRLNRSRDSVGWDERYVDNLFLARVANLKFTDNSLDLVARLDDSSKHYFRGLELQRTLAVLPRPVLNAIAPWVDKYMVANASGGDLLLFAVTREAMVLGGFRTGSLLGSSYALFGWAYPLALVILALPVFAFADAQTKRAYSPKTNQYVPLMAPLAVVTLFSWVYYLTSAATGVESTSGFSRLLVRDWIQTPLIYCAVLGITTLALGKSKRKLT